MGVDTGVKWFGAKKPWAQALFKCFSLCLSLYQKSWSLKLDVLLNSNAFAFITWNLYNLLSFLLSIKSLLFWLFILILRTAKNTITALLLLTSKIIPMSQTYDWFIMSLDWERAMVISRPGGKGETNMICVLCYIIFDCVIFEFCEMGLMNVVIPVRGYCQLFCDWHIK